MATKLIQPKTWHAIAIIGLWLAASTCSQAGSAAKSSAADPTGNEALVLVKIYRLFVDPASQQPVVTLADSAEQRAFPIWIGLSEARAIHSELQGTEHFRPLTHDLLAKIISQIGGNIHRVIITHSKDNVFYATLAVKKDDAYFEIDARPSDSIVMALKFDAPIFIDKNLFESMSVPLEESRMAGPKYGLKMQDITEEMAKYLALESSRGVMASVVRPGSQAEKDGLRTGDIIIEFDRQPLADVKSAKAIMAKSKGSLEAKIIRAKKILTLTLQIQ
ncbi:hypothetical protein D1AOALGA4SA_6050 [Olavius algarvensis Delta 1 endosymbiont]|nr:hypothetical protein D1AOALGA4SA_6050 [Olavius algarvensis Delta 1 endosymbiont]